MKSFYSKVNLVIRLAANSKIAVIVVFYCDSQFVLPLYRELKIYIIVFHPLSHSSDLLEYCLTRQFINSLLLHEEFNVKVTLEEWEVECYCTNCRYRSIQKDSP